MKGKWDEAPLGFRSAILGLPSKLPLAKTGVKREFKTFDTLKDREIKKYTHADFVDLFCQQRLELPRLLRPHILLAHQVIAERGDGAVVLMVLLDEVVSHPQLP